MQARFIWDQFIADLRDVHIQAGKPSYKQIIMRADRLRKVEGSGAAALTKTTISRVLNGAVEPKWSFVLTFLLACGVPRNVVKDVWQDKWARLIASLHPYVRAEQQPSEPSGPPPGATCSRCGSWVTNEELHERWHRQLEGGSRHVLAVNLAPAPGAAKRVPYLRPLNDSPDRRAG